MHRHNISVLNYLVARRATFISPYINQSSCCTEYRAMVGSQLSMNAAFPSTHTSTKQKHQGMRDRILPGQTWLHEIQRRRQLPSKQRGHKLDKQREPNPRTGVDSSMHLAQLPRHSHIHNSDRHGQARAERSKTEIQRKKCIKRKSNNLKTFTNIKTYHSSAMSLNISGLPGSAVGLLFVLLSLLMAYITRTRDGSLLYIITLYCKYKVCPS